MRYSRKNSKGYIALVSSIIISMILVLVVTATGFSGFLSRWNALQSDNKARGELSANACIDYAILRLREDATYLGGETVIMGENNCRILPFISIAGQTIVQVQVIVDNTYTNLKVIVDNVSFSIISSQEIPTLL